MRKLLKIEGMSCGHCVMHVQSALESIPGVKSAKVDLLERQALVEGDTLDDQALRAQSLMQATEWCRLFRKKSCRWFRQLLSAYRKGES